MTKKGFSIEVTDELHELLELFCNGIITRTVAATIPPRTDYELTKLGQELAEHLMPVGKWAKRKSKRFEKARKAYDAVNA